LRCFRFKASLQKYKDALIDYRQRLKMQGVEVSPDWRGMGAAESNVDLFKLEDGQTGPVLGRKKVWNRSYTCWACSMKTSCTIP